MKLSLLLLVTMTLLASTPSGAARDPLVFVSSFVPGEAGAIHAYRFDSEAGTLTALAQTSGISSPFFLALSPDQRFLYATSAVKFSGDAPESVVAYSIEGRSGRLTELNRQSTRGRASCYVATDASGRTLLVANYTSGDVASLPIREDGSLGEVVSFAKHAGTGGNPEVQKGPHAHAFVVSPDNRFAFAADLGIDKIMVYRLDAATATLTPHEPPFAKAPSAAGPRHITFHPNGRILYAINEMGNTVTTYDYAAETGVLTERQTIATLPADYTGTSYTADVKVTPDGQYLYGTNRGHDSIASYRIAADGTLTLLAITPSRGEKPQNLAISPDGRLLICANMPGNNLVIYRIDAATGALTAVGDPVEIPMASCIMILP